MREPFASTYHTVPLGDECHCEQCQRAVPDARKYFSRPLALPKGAFEQAYPLQPATPETESHIAEALDRLRDVVG